MPKFRGSPCVSEENRGITLRINGLTNRGVNVQMPAKDMAAYMRDRRARLKAEKNADGLANKGNAAIVRAKPASPKVIVINQRRSAEEKKWDAQLDALDGHAVWTGNGYAAPPTHLPALAPRPPMHAVGGTPGRGLVAQGAGYALPPDQAALSTFTRTQAKTEAMLAALAVRSDAQERRIAALEAQAADRKAQAVDIAQAFFGVLRTVFVGAR
jgi:hypothetical protein